MVDPFHGNRAKKQEAANIAYQKAINIPKPKPLDQLYATMSDHPWESKKVFLHPVHKYHMNEWEYNVYMQEEKDRESERVAAAADAEKADPRGGVRENQQYTLALKTAFELGMNAGLMQRPPPPPCSACERRKERNRIAAQTSRVEKRRLEQSMAHQSRRVIRSTAGAAPPAPSFTYTAQSSSTVSATTEHEDEEDDDDGSDDAGDADVDADAHNIQIPPF